MVLFFLFALFLLFVLLVLFVLFVLVLVAMHCRRGLGTGTIGDWGGERTRAAPETQALSQRLEERRRGGLAQLRRSQLGGLGLAEGFVADGRAEVLDAADGGRLPLLGLLRLLLEEEEVGVPAVEGGSGAAPAAVDGVAPLLAGDEADGEVLV